MTLKSDNCETWMCQVLKMGHAVAFLMLIWMPLITVSHQAELEQATVRLKSTDSL